MLAIKQHITRPLEKAVVDPLVKLTFDLGIGPPGDSLLETTGRRTGRPRRSRVCDGLEGGTFWLVAQYGHSTEYVQDIEANSHVRVLARSGPRIGWRNGTARILDDDDPRERTRILGQSDFWRRLCLRTSAALATSPLTVRIDLDPVEQPPHSRRRAPR
jgi:deazaflavin-dependent oxidoreductase (nitroreductase family)